MLVRPSIALGLVTIALSAFGLFQIKYEVQQMKKDLTQTYHQLKVEKQALHILQAEWSHLNQPERLEYLANTYLKELRPIEVAQLQQYSPTARQWNGAAPTQLADAVIPSVKPEYSGGQGE